MRTFDRRRVTFGLAATTLAVVGSGVKIVSAADQIKPDAASVLLVVDVQNCFLPGGSLAVKDGDQVIPVINRLARAFSSVVLTQDWHTAHHVSFASSHPGKKPFDVIKVAYGEQMLWPDHCVQGTAGAMLGKDLDLPQAQLVIRKGFRNDVDSYSAFVEADKKTSTGLAGYLKERGLSKVFVCGLATDFCVAWSAIDARRAGFEVWVIEDAARGIDAQGSLAKAWADMAQTGAKRIQSTDISLSESGRRALRFTVARKVNRSLGIVAALFFDAMSAL